MKTKKTNRRGNVKVSFQRLILLMVTIMISTALVGCDGINGNGDDTPSGKIDPKLIEKGIAYWWLSNLTTGAYDSYTFKENGTFEFYHSYNGLMEVSGKFKTSAGKIYFTDVKYEMSYQVLGIPKEGNIKEIVFEYETGKDATGDFLIIPFLSVAISDNKTFLGIDRGIKIRPYRPK